MKKIFFLTAIAFSISIIANAQNAQEIVYKAYNVNKMQGAESLSKLSIKDAKGRVRERKTSMATKLYDNGKTEKKIIRFLAPAEVKGTGMLIFDYQDKADDMWIYMPALRKTRRIVSSEKGKSFMGSEFTNADMVMPTIDDFNYKIVKNSDKVANTDCWCVSMTAKNDDVADEYGYLKRIAWIGKKDFVIRKAEVYDIDEELLKIMEVKKIELIDAKNKKYQPTHLEIKNVQNGRSSILKFEKIIFNPKVKNTYFSTTYLERL